MECDREHWEGSFHRFESACKKGQFSKQENGLLVILISDSQYSENVMPQMWQTLSAITASGVDWKIKINDGFEHVGWES